MPVSRKVHCHPLLPTGQKKTRPGTLFDGKRGEYCRGKYSVGRPGAACRRWQHMLQVSSAGVALFPTHRTTRCRLLGRRSLD